VGQSDIRNDRACIIRRFVVGRIPLSAGRKGKGGNECAYQEISNWT
jgi:hypothetical protein